MCRPPRWLDGRKQRGWHCGGLSKREDCWLSRRLRSIPPSPRWWRIGLPSVISPVHPRRIEGDPEHHWPMHACIRQVIQSVEGPGAWWSTTELYSALTSAFTSCSISVNSPELYISRTMSHPPTNSPFTYSCGTVGQSLRRTRQRHEHRRVHHAQNAPACCSHERRARRQSATYCSVRRTQTGWGGLGRAGGGQGWLTCARSW